MNNTSVVRILRNLLYDSQSLQICASQIRRVLSTSKNLVHLTRLLSRQFDGLTLERFGTDFRMEASGEAMLIKEVAPLLTHVVDVGANVGKWINLVRETRPDCNIIAFEPGNTAYEKLKSRFGNTALVKLHNKAVSYRSGQQEFFEEINAGARSSFLDSGPNSSSVKRKVDVTTLDEYFEKHNCKLPIDFLKIDTEGFDFHVLRGAEGLISSKDIKLIQFEFIHSWTKAGSSLAGALDFLQGHGYKIRVLRNEGLYQFPREIYLNFLETHPYAYANFVAYPPDLTPYIENIEKGEL